MGRVAAIILAGGRGERLGFEKPKQFLKIAGKTVLEHTLDVFQRHPEVDEIRIVAHPDYVDFVEEAVLRNAYGKVSAILRGGRTRQESSRIGVFSLEEGVEKVLIHDAVRPFVSQRIISEVIRALDRFPAVDVAVPVTDTIIRVKGNVIAEIPKRSELMRGQTPQGFLRWVIQEAHKKALKEGLESATDDCSLVVRYGLGQVYVVEGSMENIKITYPLDLFIADRLFQIRSLRVLEVLDRSALESALSMLNGKVLVVFGGTSGIGRSVAEIGKELGAKTYIFSRRTGVDVRELSLVEGALANVVDAEGRVDVVVDSAGVLKMTPIWSTSYEAIREQIEVNLLGAFNVARASIPYLKETRGSLVFLASSSYTRGRPNYTPYSASKAALVNMVQGIAVELEPIGIRVNAVSPERTKTPMRLRNFGPEPDETLLDPDAVAYVVLLVSQMGFTGQVVDVRKSKEERILRELGLIPRRGR